MTGTAKQIEYASDIINKTIARVEAIIAKDIEKVEKLEAGIREKKPDYTAKFERGIIAAWEEYRAMLASIAAMPEYPASEVIRFEKECGWVSYGNDFVCEKCGHSAF